MAEAYIKLHRKMLKWEWYDDINTCRLFLHCLLRANWQPGSWHGIDYEAGQFITSLQSLAVETNLSVSQIRTALEHLKITGEIADLRQGNYRIITVIKWGEYQSGDKPSRRPLADQSQTNRRPLATDKEYKRRIKNIKEDKEINIGARYYPNDEKLDKAFADYVAMRLQIRKPMTEKAKEIAIKKLEDLSGGDNDKAIKILEQSIMNSWQGLFPLKETKEQKHQSFFDAIANA